MGLLHGCAPDGLIYCYEVGRTSVERTRQCAIVATWHDGRCLFGELALRHPSRFIGIAMNSRNVSVTAAEEERDRIQHEFRFRL